MTQCDLADRLSIEEPTLARLLTRLESGGWIKRESAQHDRRLQDGSPATQVEPPPATD
jgi:DNA-binding MarR family transcriptional regulator